MNTNPFELPRTKIGLGGVRLINVAAATHPEAALKARPGMHPITGKPYGKPPGNTISSAQAAEPPGGSIAAYWQKMKVQELQHRQSTPGGKCRGWAWAGKRESSGWEKFREQGV